MLLKHEHYYGLGMDALVVVCCWNTNVIMVWAWMLWLLYADYRHQAYALGSSGVSGLCSGNTSSLVREIMKMCLTAGPLTGVASMNLLHDPIAVAPRNLQKFHHFLGVL